MKLNKLLYSTIALSLLGVSSVAASKSNDSLVVQAKTNHHKKFKVEKYYKFKKAKYGYGKLGVIYKDTSFSSTFGSLNQKQFKNKDFKVLGVVKVKASNGQTEFFYKVSGHGFSGYVNAENLHTTTSATHAKKNGKKTNHGKKNRGKKNNGKKNTTAKSSSAAKSSASSKTSSSSNNASSSSSYFTTVDVNNGGYQYTPSYPSSSQSNWNGSSNNSTTGISSATNGSSSTTTPISSSSSEVSAVSNGNSSATATTNSGSVSNSSSATSSNDHNSVASAKSSSNSTSATTSGSSSSTSTPSSAKGSSNSTSSSTSGSSSSTSTPSSAKGSSNSTSATTSGSSSSTSTSSSAKGSSNSTSASTNSSASSNSTSSSAKGSSTSTPSSTNDSSSSTSTPSSANSSSANSTPSSTSGSSSSTSTPSSANSSAASSQNSDDALIQSYQAQALQIGNGSSDTDIYATKPTYSNGSFNAGKLNPTYINNTTQWVNFFRGMFGLDSLSSDDQWNQNAQSAAAALNAVNSGNDDAANGLDSSGVSKPSGIKSSDWKTIKDTYGNSIWDSNNTSPYGVITDYLNDSNIAGSNSAPDDRLSLLGNINKIGIGQAGIFNNIQVTDDNDDTETDAFPGAINFPSNGVFPYELVSNGATWSVALPNDYNNNSTTPTVTVHDNTANQNVNVSGTQMGGTTSNSDGSTNDGPGYFGSYVWFTPDSKAIQADHSYTVTINNLPGTTSPYTYTTKLFNLLPGSNN